MTMPRDTTCGASTSNLSAEDHVQPWESTISLSSRVCYHVPVPTFSPVCESSATSLFSHGIPHSFISQIGPSVVLCPIC